MLWIAWARGSFRNFRLNEQQLQLERSGRCDKAAKALSPKSGREDSVHSHKIKKI